MGWGCIGSSHKLYPIQLSKEQSPLLGTLCLHPLPRVSSRHLIDRDEWEQLTNPARDNPFSSLPPLQAPYPARSVRPCGCNMLSRALGSGRALPCSCATGVRADAERSFAALSSSVRLNQLRKGVFLLATDALKPAGREGRMEKVRQQSKAPGTALLRAIHTSMGRDSYQSLRPAGLHATWFPQSLFNAQTLHMPSITYLSAPDCRFLLKQSSEMWKSSQGLPP